MSKKRYDSLAEYPGPNTKQTHQWATFLVSRNVQFKVHENRGHALNAIVDTRAGILYRWNETLKEWDEVLRVEGWKYDTGVVCANCDRPHDEIYTDENGRECHVYLERVWLNLKAEVPYLTYLCRDCQRDAKRLGLKQKIGT